MKLRFKSLKRIRKASGHENQYPLSADVSNPTFENVADSESNSSGNKKEFKKYLKPCEQLLGIIAKDSSILEESEFEVIRTRLIDIMKNMDIKDEVNSLHNQQRSVSAPLPLLQESSSVEDDSSFQSDLMNFAPAYKPDESKAKHIEEQLNKSVSSGVVLANSNPNIYQVKLREPRRSRRAVLASNNTDFYKEQGLPSPKIDRYQGLTLPKRIHLGETSTKLDI